MQPIISVKGLTKFFGAHEVLRGVSFNVNRGEVLVLLGASGSGKSTLLRCLNLLEKPSSGVLNINGMQAEFPQSSNRMSGAALAKLRQRTGMVFQQFNLFPHLTVLQNVASGPYFALRRPRAEIEAEALTLLAQVGLAEKTHSFPVQLSGGQCQRVAIARALAMRPSVMLFDEPTSALDPELVGEVLHVIKKLADSGMTMIIVTHEIDFAAEVATDVIFLDQGIILEKGPAASLIRQPQNPRTQDFLARFNARATFS